EGAARKAQHREHGAERQADEAGNRRRREADGKRQLDDREKAGRGEVPPEHSYLMRTSSVLLQGDEASPSPPSALTRALSAAPGRAPLPRCARQGAQD